MTDAPQIEIMRLFISPAHNYFGHHGAAAGEHATLAVEEVCCLAGRGIQGDRFLDYKKNYKGQITFFEWEIYDNLRRELDAGDVEPSVFRRNVITRGIDLNTLIGKKFEIQGVQFEGTEECRPCQWMDSAFAPGAEERMRGHGGLRARILTDGFLRANVTVKP
jgi:MOSC domain-containing protein YiiM